MSATGFYATPGIYWDRVAGRGNPFHYFACGAAVSEVEVDGFTGMTRVLRTDILHDVGDSINEAVNRGQVEGGFVLGMGWLTTEKLKWDERGRLLTHSPDTYKIPAVGDMPKVFNVTLLKNAAQKGVVYGSKSCRRAAIHAGDFRARSYTRCRRRLRLSRSRGAARVAGDVRGDLHGDSTAVEMPQSVGGTVGVYCGSRLGIAFKIGSRIRRRGSGGRL